jgi:hypothetical protein
MMSYERRDAPPGQELQRFERGGRLVPWIGLLLAAAVLVGVAGPLGVRTAGAATTATNETLAARLGGTRASFVAAFGDPIGDNEASGSRYDVPGFGLVLVQYLQQENAVLAPEDRATVVTLRSPRPDATAATTPDDADWSIDQAFQAVTRFLPADVALAGPATPEATAADGQGLERSCHSDALAAVFPNEPAPGACQIAFLMPTSVTVSYVTLVLGDDGADGGTADRCAGMRAWGQETGARMQSALETLAEIAAIADDDPSAAAQLRTAAARFADLAAAQAAAPPPRAATRASEQLVAAFDGFAVATEAAAAGVEANDRDAVGRAVADLEAAQALFDAANALVLSVLQRCDLAD